MTETKTSPKKFSISMSFVIYASPEKVFDALTIEGLIGQWCDGGGKVKLEVDGEVELFDGWVKGKVVTFDKRKTKLAYTWKPSEWDKRTAASLVEYEFKSHSAGTEVLLQHSGFPSREEADKHLNGWTDYVFEPLNDFFTL